jgi:hypothetical protein
MMSLKEKGFFTLQEISRIYHLTDDHLALLCRQGKLRAQRVGKRWFTKKEWVEEYLQALRQRYDQQRAPRLANPDSVSNDLKDDSGNRGDRKNSFGSRVKEKSWWYRRLQKAQKVQKKSDIWEQELFSNEEGGSFPDVVDKLKKVKLEKKFHFRPIAAVIVAVIFVISLLFFSFVSADTSFLGSSFQKAGQASALIIKHVGESFSDAAAVASFAFSSVKKQMAANFNQFNRSVSSLSKIFHKRARNLFSRISFNADRLYARSAFGLTSGLEFLKTRLEEVLVLSGDILADINNAALGIVQISEEKFKSAFETIKSIPAGFKELAEYKNPRQEEPLEEVLMADGSAELEEESSEEAEGTAATSLASPASAPSMGGGPITINGSSGSGDTLISEVQLIKSELESLKQKGIVTNEKVVERVFEKEVSGLAQEDLDKALAELNSSILSRVAGLREEMLRKASGNFNAISLTQRIDQLYSPSITGGVSVSGTATFANGITITGGCYKLADGTCLTSGSGSGTVGSGTLGQIPYYASAGSALTATSSIYLATTTFVGVGTTSPTDKLHVQWDHNERTRIVVENALDDTTAGAFFSAKSANSELLFGALPDAYQNGLSHFAGRAVLISGITLMNLLDTAGLDLVAATTTGDIRFYSGGWATTNERVRIDSSGKLGIGTTSPDLQLSIGAGGGIIAKGTYGSGSVLETSGQGTRLIWYPRKSAFRAGFVDSVQWDEANIGDFSAALGYTTTASGVSSIAMGNTATATGYASISLGQLTLASATSSVALGYNTAASGIAAVALGHTTTASGYLSIAFGGYNTTASATTSIAMGHSATSSGYASLSAGWGTLASATTSVALGYNTTASGGYSTAIGAGITVSGTHSFGVALDNVSEDVTGNNVMAILGGNLGVGTTSPYARLSVVGETVAEYFTATSTTATTTLAGGLNVGSGGLVYDSSSANIGLGTANPLELLHLNHGNLRFEQEPAPSSAPTVAVNSTPGNLNGTYTYLVTFVTSRGETEPGPGSNSVSPSGEQVDLTSIPTGSSNVIARRIYRSTGNTPSSDYQLVTTINDNTTTSYTDNIADGSLGDYAPFKNTTGGMVFLNSSASTTIVADNALTALGVNAGDLNQGYANTFIGKNAGRLTTTGDKNTFLGFEAGYSNTTGGENVFVGQNAGNANTTGTYNVFVGEEAGKSNISGTNNTFVGWQSGQNNTYGLGNLFFGSRAGNSNTTGDYNLFLGDDSGYLNETGSWNVFIGKNAGYSNVSGDNNVFIGPEAGYNETGSNKLYIHNSSTTEPLIYGDFSNALLGFSTSTLLNKISVFGDGRDTDIGLVASTSPGGNLFYYNWTLGIDLDDGGKFKISSSTTLGTNDRFVIDGAGNVGIGTGTFGTGAGGVIGIASSTAAPGSSPPDMVQLFAEDILGSSELRVRDEAGNVTTLSPHNYTLFTPDASYLNPWSYYSKNEVLNREINVDMYGAIRQIELLSGKRFIYTRRLDDGVLDPFDAGPVALEIGTSSPISSPTFTKGGTGLNDLAIGGVYEGNSLVNYRVEIDGTNPDTFRWSKDGGNSWEETREEIEDEEQELDDGVSITFGSATGHVFGDQWDFQASPPSISEPVFSGSGVNDMNLGEGSLFTGSSVTNYRVEIEEIGQGNSPDRFRWSDDGGATWEEENIPITNSVRTLNNGVKVRFENRRGHAVGDYWDFTATPSSLSSVVYSEGEGLNDLTAGGSFTGDSVVHYVVEIDSTDGDKDTFRWSDDGGSSWEAEGVEVEGMISLNNGVKVRFGLNNSGDDSRSSHTVGDRWEFTASPSESRIIAEFHNRDGGAVFTIDSSGNVGVATTSPWRSLSINGSVAMANLSVGTGQALKIDPTTFEVLRNTSSRRYKDSISDIEFDTSKIYALRPVSFTWNEKTANNGKRDFGLIAEDVAQILPQLVLYDASGTPDSVRYSMLSVLLLKELQKQKQTLDSLKAQVGGMSIQNLAPAVGASADSGGENIVSRGIDWLVSSLKELGIQIADGVLKVREFISEKITTKKLCLEDVCITKDQLRSILNENNNPDANLGSTGKLDEPNGPSNSDDSNRDNPDLENNLETH